MEQIKRLIDKIFSDTCRPVSETREELRDHIDMLIESLEDK